MVDSAQSAAFGLVPAQLCNSDGSSCVGPTDDSVTSALGSATADSSGLLHVNPASTPAGAYPLVDVTYAAVSTNNNDPAAVADYANFIKYAAGAGQTPGEAPGDLPRGYLPLPAKLQATAEAVATSLLVGTSISSSSAAGSTVAGSSGSVDAVNGIGSGGIGGGSGGINGGVAATSAGQPASSTSKGPAAVIRPTSTPMIYSTPAQATPVARYTAIAVILAGIAGLVGSPATTYFGRRRAGGIRR